MIPIIMITLLGNPRPVHNLITQFFTARRQVEEGEHLPCKAPKATNTETRAPTGRILMQNDTNTNKHVQINGLWDLLDTLGVLILYASAQTELRNAGKQNPVPSISATVSLSATCVSSFAGCFTSASASFSFVSSSATAVPLACFCVRVAGSKPS